MTIKTSFELTKQITEVTKILHKKQDVFVKH